MIMISRMIPNVWSGAQDPNPSKPEEEPLEEVPFKGKRLGFPRNINPGVPCIGGCSRDTFVLVGEMSRDHLIVNDTLGGEWKHFSWAAVAL